MDEQRGHLCLLHCGLYYWGLGIHRDQDAFCFYFDVTRNLPLERWLAQQGSGLDLSSGTRGAKTPLMSSLLVAMRTHPGHVN